MEQQEDQQTPDRRGRKVARVVIEAVKIAAGQLIAWGLRQWLG